MHRDTQASAWTAVCGVEEIVPNTGVCALLQGQQVAVFRMNDGADSRVFAIGNYDPNSEASVLSRGLVGNLGERIVVAPIDISALRHEREVRSGHHMLAHLRTDAYPVYRQPIYPPKSGQGPDGELTFEKNNELIDESKRRLNAKTDS